MVTKDKIAIYKKYGGDVDMWARAGKLKELEIMNDGDWFLIDELIQNVVVMQRGLASVDRSKEILSKLEDNVANDEVKSQILKIAEKER